MARGRHRLCSVIRTLSVLECAKAFPASPDIAKAWFEIQRRPRISLPGKPRHSSWTFYCRRPDQTWREQTAQQTRDAAAGEANGKDRLIGWSRSTEEDAKRRCAMPRHATPLHFTTRDDTTLHDNVTTRHGTARHDFTHNTHSICMVQCLGLPDG